MDEQGVDFMLTLSSNGSPTVKVIDSSKLKSEAKSYRKKYKTLIHEVKSASHTFYKSSSGKNIIKGIKSHSKDDVLAGASEPNYVQKTIENPAFSGLNLGSKSGPNAPIGPTIVVGAALSGSVIFGAATSAGEAWNPWQSVSELYGFKSDSFTIGTSVGVAANFMIGFFAGPPEDLAGFSFSVIVGAELGKLGGEVTVVFDFEGNFIGLTIGVGVGIELEAAIGFDQTTTVELTGATSRDRPAVSGTPTPQAARAARC